MSHPHPTEGKPQSLSGGVFPVDTLVETVIASVEVVLLRRNLTAWATVDGVREGGRESRGHRGEAAAAHLSEIPAFACVAGLQAGESSL